MTRLTILALVLLPATSWAQPNLAPYHHPNWTFPVTPTNSPQFGNPAVLLPDGLIGNVETTYLNAGFINGGDATAVGTYSMEFYLDGDPLSLATMTDQLAGPPSYHVNSLPIVVPGGRHMLSHGLDVTGAIAESDEDDNVWGRQFVWSPDLLSEGIGYSGAEPPEPFAGHDHAATPPPAANCNGYGVVSDAPWTAVFINAGGSADYDLRLFEIPPVRDDSFIAPIAVSDAPDWLTDFVLINRSQAGTSAFDVGITKYSGTGFHLIAKEPSTPLAIGDEELQSLWAHKYIQVRELVIGPGETGPLTVGADTEPGRALGLSIYDASQSFAGRYDAAATAQAGPDGTLRLRYDFSTPGSYALVVHRDVIYSPAQQEFTWTVTDEVVDAAPFRLPGWHAALSPRNTQDATVTSVPLPPALIGWGTTWLNYAAINDGASTIPSLTVGGWRDGLAGDPETAFTLSHILDLGPGGILTGLNAMSLSVPGGRHTLTFVTDPNDVYFEYDEANNIWGEQYVWPPSYLPMGGYLLGTSKANWDGGYGEITSGEPWGAVCDGFRLPGSTGYWRAVAVACDTGDDFDLTLHDPSAGSKDGFHAALQGSAFGSGYLDYVLVNDNVFDGSELDVGVKRNGSVAPDYLLDCQAAVTVFGDPTLVPLGPSTLSPNEFIQVWDIYLEPDTYTFQLDALAGAVDWGIQLHWHDRAFQSRHEHVGWSFANSPGVEEYFNVTIGEAGWYGLAVYRSKTGSPPEEGTYRVRVHRGVTAVDEAPAAAALRIAAASPNPFNPSTRIAYELAAPTEIGLEVFDMQGALVRVLAAGRREPGTHEAVWDGRDDSGRRMPSGTYVARLCGGGAVDRCKLILVK